MWLTWPFHINIFGGQQNSCICHKSNNGPNGVYLDYCDSCPVYPTLTHTWDDCFNNPKNHFTGAQHANGQERGSQTRHGSYYSNQREQGSGCGYYSPCQLTSSPTLYIQQAPVTNTTTFFLSTETKTGTSSTILNQAYVIIPMNTKRGETNSQWLHNKVVFYDRDMRNHTFNQDTVVHETNIINQILPHAASHSHHFRSLCFTFPQDGGLLGVLPGKQNTFYAFDTMYIHEGDNFQIYIHILNNQHTHMNTIQQDLLPVSQLIPKYTQLIPNL
jgi:hypothetical protein